MDKEYTERLDEIQQLMKSGKTEDALDYLDSLNWHKIHNINALLKASSLYEQAGKLEESKELLLFAHERSPIGRTVLFHLALACVRMNDLEEAKEYYDEFVEIAPHDSQKYIIKYQLYKAKGVDDYGLINILEELNDHEFIDEQWAFELAYLYHRTSQIEKCIDLCDKISLYFGDGPYVERALELKMLYSPLDEGQEDKYRSFQLKKSDLTEIKANEQLDSGEIVPHTITIPKVELKADRFNTINLQAEIKKNIEEIMQATEAGEINENMEAIKELVEEIPYLQIPSETAEEEKRRAEEELNDAIKDKFQEYLVDEYDGQMSLFIPEEDIVEEQVAGQMTIEDVMENWEKTMRAAEATLQDAEELKLENAKQSALREANHIMDRLTDVIPKLDAGLTPSDLLREEYMSAENVLALTEDADFDMDEKAIDEFESEDAPKESVDMAEITIPVDAVEENEQENIDTEESDSDVEGSAEDKKTFTIPSITPDGGVGIGLEIPIVDPVGVPLVKGDILSEIPSITKSEAVPEKTTEWMPPVLSEETDNEEEVQETSSNVDTLEASKIIESVNNMLQKEIDRLYEEAEEATEEVAPEPAISIEDALLAEALSEPDVRKPVEQKFDSEEEALAAEVDGIMLEQAIEEAALSEEGNVGEPTMEQLIKENEEDEIVKAVDEKALEAAIAEEIPMTVLTADEKELFSYFLPVNGMETNICQVLTGAKQRLKNIKNSSTGNIIIQGGKGSGKTTMATSLIKVLQNSIGKPAGNVGRIDADKLNEKDIQALFEKINGGCLIIENAGNLNRDTTVTLSLLMDSDQSGILVILEDSRVGIDKLKNENAQFMRKFTEKINIPAFKLDDLVEFAVTYASQEGYGIDEMAKLALYDKLGIAARTEQTLQLDYVKELVDDAIDRAERGGLRGFFGRLGSGRTDDEGNLILMEKDFLD